MQLAVCAILIAAACVSVAQATNHCRAPSFPANGGHSGRGQSYFPPGKILKFRCNSGYRLQGWSSTMCYYNRQSMSYKWTKPPPLCISVKDQSNDRDRGNNDRSDDKSRSRSDSTSDGVVRHGVQCPVLPSIHYGFVTYGSDSRRPGCIAKYTCRYGYTLSGSPYRKCLRSGEWNGRKPSCVRPDREDDSRDDKSDSSDSSSSKPRVQGCGHPERLENGWVKYKSTKPGAKAWHFCKQGYNLYGSETRTCRYSGQWEPKPPVCKPGCNKLKCPKNGVVRTNGTTVGSYAKYVCDLDHYRVGNLFRKCLETGWTGEDAVCKPIVCDPLDPPEHGRIFLTKGYKYGSVAKYKCGYGYVVEEGSGDVKRECKVDGLWSGSPITCTKYSH